MGNFIALLTQPIDEDRSALLSRLLANSWHRSITAGLIGVGLFVGALSSHADIRFEDKGEGASRGERFSLDVRDEPIANVMDKLAERYDFAVDGYPEHWSDDPMNFSATGDLERVLRSLLKDTSHVFEYRTDLATKVTRITKLNLLNEGVEGIMASTPTPTATFDNDGGTITRGSGNRRPGSLSDRVTTNGQQGLDADYNSPTAASSATAGSPGTNSPSRPVVSSQVSGLSASLEQRARQTSGAAPNSDGAASTGTASAAPIDPGAPNADMQALTQKALQDVRGLAEALRKAENGGQ